MKGHTLRSRTSASSRNRGRQVGREIIGHGSREEVAGEAVALTGDVHLVALILGAIGDTFVGCVGHGAARAGHVVAHGNAADILGAA